MVEHRAAAADNMTTEWQARYPFSRISSWRAGGEVAWLFTPQAAAAQDAEGAAKAGKAAKMAEANNAGEAARGDEFIGGEAAAAFLAPLRAPPPGVDTSGCSEAPLFVGFGSNLLVRDGGYNGVAVRTAPALRALRLQQDGAVYAAAGVPCPKFARFCAAHNLDAAFFAGIPGTVGGALAMNAGCYGSETWEFVDYVTILRHGDGSDRDNGGGGIARLPASAFKVAYRHVERRPVGVEGAEKSPPLAAAPLYFTGGCFRLPRGERAVIEKKIKHWLRQRAQSQPLGNASAGSVFCNPPGDYAGRLVESCGLKKTRVGGACVSDKHANFIVNDSDASAADIETLMLLVQKTVLEKTGIRLTPEVRIVGKGA